jgi:hypothetical protein
VASEMGTGTWPSTAGASSHFRGHSRTKQHWPVPFFLISSLSHPIVNLSRRPRSLNGRRTFALSAWLIVAGLSCAPNNSGRFKPGSIHSGASETTAPAEEKIVNGQTLYAPIYSQVVTADGGHPFNLAATLFVRNTDRSKPIILTRVEYFDSGGKSLRSFIKSPIKIEPMASVDFFIEESDETGGPSPSFLVEWVATEAVSSPLVESVMIGTTGSQGVSFTCQARVVQSRSSISAQALRQ